jgi:hypothetical protein
MKYLSIAGFMIAFLLISCSKSKVPSGILEPEKMQLVLWDYIRADVFANEFIRKDSSKNVELESARLQQQVFQLHKVTKEQFYKSYQYYLTHQLIMKEMMDTMVVRQQRAVEIKRDSMGLKTIKY